MDMVFDTRAGPAADARRGSPAVLVSAMLHVAALAGLVLLVHPHRPARLPPPLVVSVLAIPPPPPAPEAAAAMPGALAATALAGVTLDAHAVRAVLDLRPVARARIPPRIRARPTAPNQAAPIPAAPIPIPPAAAAAASEPQAPPAAAADGTVEALATRIRAAVQQAAIYPPAARLQGRQGRARIQFDYQAGSAAAVSLAASSRSTLLDQAALEAVRRAALPPPPATIGARRLTLLVWVDFRLAATN